jgi:hypothetical protein
MTDDREIKIRERAQRIWEEEGFPDGKDEEHWKQAEREFDQAESSVGQDVNDPTHGPIPAPTPDAVKEQGPARGIPRGETTTRINLDP